MIDMKKTGLIIFAYSLRFTIITVLLNMNLNIQELGLH